MTDVPPVRGGVYPYQGTRRGTFAVLSVDPLNVSGTVIVVEVVDDVPDDVLGLLAVQMSADDPQPGSWMLCWRINYAAAERLEVAAGHGELSAPTLATVVAAVRNALEPL